MLSSRTTFLIGLAVSAALHAALYKTAEKYAGGWGGPQAKKPDRKSKTQVVKPDLIVLPPPPKKDEFGEKGGTGDAINSSEGDQPQMALKSTRDQAALTRDPTGQGPITPPASPKPLSQAVVAPPPAAVPTPPPSPIPSFHKPNKPTPPAPPAPEARPTPPTPSTPPTDSTPPQAAGGTPLPQTDQDSDLFAKEVSVEFKRGKVSARSGRQFKFTRPRVNLSQMVEAAEISFPAILKFHLTITPEGKIRRAEITKSTGSPSIDRAFLLAMYESWMEPKRDRNGKAIADETDFTMSIE